MNVLVVGAGEMGRWFARTLGEDTDISVTDSDPAVAEAAAERLGARAVALDGTETFEVVCIAVPMPVAAEAIAAQADRATAAVVDLSGVMADPLAAMREHAPDLERVSLHPLFSAANAPGNVAAVVDNEGPTAAAIQTALVEAGNTWVETTAEEHDRAMETVQASAHAAVLAFGLAAADVPEQFHTPVSAGLFDLLEQVTGNDPRVYSDIQDTFEGAEAVADAAQRLAAADPETFADLYREAAR